MLLEKLVRSYVMGILGGTFWVISRFLGSKEPLGCWVLRGGFWFSPLDGWAVVDEGGAEVLRGLTSLVLLSRCCVSPWGC